MATYEGDDLKMIMISGPLWLRMLAERERRILNKIHGAYKNGEKEFMGMLAEYATIRDQIVEVTNALKQED